MVFSVTSSILYKIVGQFCPVEHLPATYHDQYLLNTQIWSPEMAPQDHFVYLIGPEDLRKNRRRFRYGSSQGSPYAERTVKRSDNDRDDRGEGADGKDQQYRRHIHFHNELRDLGHAAHPVQTFRKAGGKQNNQAQIFQIVADGCKEDLQCLGHGLPAASDGHRQEQNDQYR